MSIDKNIHDYLVVKGAKENNLKNVDVTIPKNKLVVFTGVSGSGKSTLAFDTIFAEGQRRYVESLSSYARQFLGNFEKPDVESIDGLSPAISIDQKTTSHNPRSTVGTVTEIYDYLRLLFSRIGKAYCPKHNRVIEKNSINQIANQLLKKANNQKVTLLAPIVKNEKGTFYETLKKFVDLAFTRFRIDSENIINYPSAPLLEKNKKHNIDVVIDRLLVCEDNMTRLYDSLRTCFDYANGNLIVVYHKQNPDGSKELLNDKEDFFSEKLACPECGFSVPPLEPRLFSFNSPIGCCPTCKGLGVTIHADINKVIPDQSLSILKGAIIYLKESKIDNIEMQQILAICKEYGIDPSKPFSSYTQEQKDLIFYGPKEPITTTFRTKTSNRLVDVVVDEGVGTRLNRLYFTTSSQQMKEWYEQFMSYTTCPTCQGARLSKEVLSVRIDGLNIDEVCHLPLNKLKEFILNLKNKLSEEELTISDMVITEIINRTSFLIDVGLDYLDLARLAMTLSGGESQRIRLATQIGSKLSGVLYVLDEPSIGLHQKDNDKLIATLKSMRDLGNSLIVVEHDEETIESADYVVDIGPLAGDHGGEIVFSGTPEELKNYDKSLTGNYLSGKLQIEIPQRRRESKYFIEVKGAHAHNLKNINVKFKLGCLNVVTGVSGSGKSTLVNDILYNFLSDKLSKQNIKNKNADCFYENSKIECKGVYLPDMVLKVINVSQDPIGKTPRSNPATYIGVFDDIRELFSQTADAKMNGITKSMFSFNIPGGRCEKCWGDGVKRISMNFLPDVYVKCEVCDGKRYNNDVLAVTYKGKNIFDVLEMPIDEAYEFFKNIPSIERKIKTLIDVGLGYMKLGQSSTTLSGGEAQRVKLAKELQKKAETGTVYIFDEPTTGLHTHDVKKLINILDRIVNNGNTCIVIEHNLDVIKCADYIVDLGPDGGERGGTLVVSGTPEDVVKCKESYTGQYLLKTLNRFK